MTLGKIQQLVKKWQVRLGLTHWEIRTRIKEGQIDGSFMEISIHEDGHWRAFIDVQPWVVGQGEEPDWVMEKDATGESFVERIVVHELLHCHFFSVGRIAKEMAQENLGDQAMEIFRTAWLQNEEQAVDVMARALQEAWQQQS